jgi:hypothetical protein
VKSSDSPSSADAAGPGERAPGAAGDCRALTGGFSGFLSGFLPKMEKAKSNQQLRK